MRTFVSTCGLILLFSLTGYTEVQGQTAECQDVLQARTTHWTNLNLIEQNAALNLVDERNYEESKQKYNAIVPGYFDGDFQSFKQRRASRFQQTSYQSSKFQSQQELRIELPPDAVSAWLTCVTQTSSNLFAYIDEIDEAAVTLKIKWAAPPGLPGINVTPQLINVAPGSLLDAPVLIQPHGEVRVILTRQNRSAALRGTLNGVVGTGMYAASFYVPVKTPPPQPPCKRTNVDGKCLVCGWAQKNIRWAADTSEPIRCPNMAAGGDVRMTAAIAQFYQEDWGPPDAERSHKNRHRLMRGTQQKWAGGFAFDSPSTRKCSISSFMNQFDQSLERDDIRSARILRF